MNNVAGQELMPDLDSSEHCMLHYCFEGPGFNKRMFKWDVEVEDPEFWSVPSGDATIDGFLRQQFLETGKYFHLSDLP